MPLTVSARRHWGQGVRYAWPHDGPRGFGNQGPIKDRYKDEGLSMRPVHAQFPRGGFSPENAIKYLLERMQTGRFKVFKHLQPFWNEYSTYHRKDGLLVQQRDDLISALLKVVMDLRYARVPSGYLDYSADVVSDFDPFARAR